MKRLLFIAAAVAVIATWLFWPRTADVPVRRSQPEETLLSSLNRRDARLYIGNDPNPFSGLAVEHYHNGSVKSRSVVAGGLLHGLSEGWHTNGQKQVSEHFIRGVSHGQRTKWYTDGQMQSQAHIANGQLQGTFRRWHSNGTLAEEVQFEHGKPHGSAHAYYPSGFLKRSVTMEHGVIVRQNSYSDGERQASADIHGAQLY